MNITKNIPRRTFLAQSALAALGWIARSGSALGSVTVGAQKDQVLVNLFLRGGADGLSLVAPHAEDDYYRARPNLALARPGDKTAGVSERLLDLDGFFGLHPSLAPLLPLYQSGQCAIVHACGSGDQTRSHFEARAAVERGLYRDQGPSSGWLARYLAASEESEAPLRAVGVGDVLPQSLAGASGVTVLQNVDDLTLRVPFAGQDAAVRAKLASLYAHGNDAARRAGRESLALLRLLERRAHGGSDAPGAVYPACDLGHGLRQVARLMKSDVGLEVACLEQDGYDTHVAQGAGKGILSGNLSDLAKSLTAFIADIGPARWAKTTIVVLSEFGRRVGENDGEGTDHGRAGVLFVLGGRGLAGGHVHGTWPALAPDSLEGPGDLKVTTDYRNVLTEILQKRQGCPQAASLFPGLSYNPVGLTYA